MPEHEGIVDNFLSAHGQATHQTSFWVEEYRVLVIRSIEAQFKPEIVKYWQISDVVVNGDKFLIKWSKRIIPG
jgi:hypothetical protein